MSTTTSGPATGLVKIGTRYLNLSQVRMIKDHTEVNLMMVHIGDEEFAFGGTHANALRAFLNDHVPDVLASST